MQGWHASLPLLPIPALVLEQSKSKSDSKPLGKKRVSACTCVVVQRQHILPARHGEGFARPGLAIGEDGDVEPRQSCVQELGDAAGTYHVCLQYSGLRVLGFRVQGSGRVHVVCKV